MRRYTRERDRETEGKKVGEGEMISKGGEAEWRGLSKVVRQH